MDRDSEWFDPSGIIQNSNKITDVFGYWPTFHDAWIQSLCLTVGSGENWEDGYGSEPPTLVMKLHVYEMTKEVAAEGYIVLAKHTFAELKFLDIEKLELRNFSYQNSIYELAFGTELADQPGPGGVYANILRVKLKSFPGICAEFRCRTAEVVSAVPCDANGNVNA
jgi:hypothetical protein